MKIASKTLVTLFVIGLLAMNAPVVSAASTSSMQQRQTRRFEKVYQHHDRKLELRAGVLGISVDQLKEELKTASFERVVKRHGFKNMEAFDTAVLGKIKDELTHRGWNEKKINKSVAKRVDRMNR